MQIRLGFSVTANHLRHIQAAYENCTRYVDHSQARYHPQMPARGFSSMHLPSESTGITVTNRSPRHPRPAAAIWQTFAGSGRMPHSKPSLLDCE